MIRFFILISFLLPVLAAYGDKPRTSHEETALGRLATPPLGLPPLDKNLIGKATIRKYELGRKLFFDKQLSRDGSISCALCHKPTEAFTEKGFRTSPGFKEQKNRRNTPTLLNVAYFERLHLDGRETSLETQFILPLTAHDEMASRSVGFVIQKLAWLPDYGRLFQEAFGKPPSVDTLGEALSTYQRTLVSGNSRFDRWYFGKEQNALTGQEIAGFELFKGKANCESCHRISENHALFTDQTFHDIGHGWEQNLKKPEGRQDLGRFEVTHDPLDRWRYRTPTLRNIAVTAPYMHDGAFDTLRQVIDFYNKGGAPHSGQDQRIKKLDLTEPEIEALIAFLQTLTGDNLEQLAREGQAGAAKNN